MYSHQISRYNLDSSLHSKYLVTDFVFKLRFLPGWCQSWSGVAPCVGACRTRPEQTSRLPGRSVARTWWWELLHKDRRHTKDSKQELKLLVVLLKKLLRPLPTLFTPAHVQHAGAQAVPRRDTEACVGGVHGQIGKHLAGGAEAVPRDPLHVHVLLVFGVQRPLKQGETPGNRYK